MRLFSLKYNPLLVLAFAVLILFSCQKGNEPIPMVDSDNTSVSDYSAMREGDDGSGVSDDSPRGVGDNDPSGDLPGDDGGTVIGGDDNEDDDDLDASTGVVVGDGIGGGGLGDEPVSDAGGN